MKKWIAAVCGLLLVWNSWLTYRLVTTSSPKENDNNPSTIDEEQIIDYTTDVTALVESVQSSIVSISTRSKGNVASGVIYANEGNTVYIFSSLDEVSDEEYLVTFASSYSVPLTVVGVDEGTGLVLFSCEPGFETQPLKSGDSDLLHPGEYVLAIGGKNPNNGTSSLSFGIVSDPGQRRISNSVNWWAEVIETDATVNDSNVGGALLDVGGSLVGILIHQPINGEEEMNYAITANEVKLVYEQLKEEGQIVRRTSLNIITNDVANMAAYEKSAFDINLDLTRGVIVTAVNNETTREYIQPGDVILKLNDEDINNGSSLRTMLYTIDEETPINLTILREGSETTVSIPRE